MEDAASPPPAVGRTATSNFDESAPIEKIRHLLKAECWPPPYFQPTVTPQAAYSLAERVLKFDPVMIELDRIAKRWYGDAISDRHRS